MRLATRMFCNEDSQDPPRKTRYPLIFINFLSNRTTLFGPASGEDNSPDMVYGTEYVVLPLLSLVSFGPSCHPSFREQEG